MINEIRYIEKEIFFQILWFIYINYTYWVVFYNDKFGNPSIQEFFEKYLFLAS